MNPSPAWLLPLAVALWIVLCTNHGPSSGAVLTAEWCGREQIPLSVVPDQSADRSPSLQLSQGDKTDSARVAERKWYPADWDLQIVSVSLNASTISEVHCTLCNLSDRPAMMDRNYVSAWLWSGVRIWKKGVAGSYCLRIDPRRNLFRDPDIEMGCVQPGETMRLDWKAEPPPGDRRGMYEIVFVSRLAIDRNSIANAVDLVCKEEYVVDASVSLLLLERDAQGQSATGMERVVVQSSNKVWVVACDGVQ